jgi:hypothetical protein
MLKKNTRGMFSQLLVIVLILSAAILIMLVVMKFLYSNNAKGAIDTCRFSVVAQSATALKVDSSGLTSPIAINCEKRYVNLFNNKVEIGNNPEDTDTAQIVYNNKPVKKFLELNDFIVNQIVAEEMRICWYQFGQGRVKVFANDKNVLENSNVCFICSEISFKDNMGKSEFVGLADYLNQTYIANEKMTYYQYLNDASMSAETFEQYNKDAKSSGKTNIYDIKLYKDKTYYIIFKKGDWTFRSSYRFYPIIISSDEINGYDAYDHSLCDMQAT